MMIVGHIEKNGVKFTARCVPIVKRKGYDKLGYQIIRYGDHQESEDNIFDFMILDSMLPLDIDAKNLEKARDQLIEMLGNNYCSCCSVDRDAKK